MSKVTFNTVVSRLKTAIRGRVKKGAIEVSALDISNVMRTASNNSSRGAAVRRAFADLVNEGFLVPTEFAEYNADTHHSVTVYRTR
jgi:hypothetical protein